jgi:predicted outer membrane repeat protein
MFALLIFAWQITANAGQGDVMNWTSLKSACRSSGTIVLGSAFDISDYDAPITIDGSTKVVIEGNGVVLDGGGVCFFFLVNSSGASLKINKLTLQKGFNWSGNCPGGAGGAIRVIDGALIVQSSQFDSNIGAGYGGGGAIHGQNAKVAIYDTLFVNNQATYYGFGGAIFTEKGGSLLLSNTTFQDNKAADSHSDAGLGGAICVFNGTLMLRQVTFSGNTVEIAGGAIYLKYSSADIQGGIFAGTGSLNNNDIARDSKSDQVTFECPVGMGGQKVEMQALELAKPPSETELKCSAARYLCNTATHTCVQESVGTTFSVCNASCSCVTPPNCGIHNDTTVCSHAFQGCDVCTRCCKSYIKNDNDCSGCVDTECKDGHKECCT